MTREEAKKVKAWLYSIPRTEIALINLRKALADLETRAESPPTWMRVPTDGVMIFGSEGGSKQESWIQFMDEYPARKSFLEDTIADKEGKLKQFWATLDQLAKENNKAAEVIRKKFYDQVKPDKAIYTMFMFCTEETFYRSLRKGIQFYFDVMFCLMRP